MITIFFNIFIDDNNIAQYIVFRNIVGCVHCKAVMWSGGAQFERFKLFLGFAYY